MLLIVILQGELGEGYGGFQNVTFLLLSNWTMLYVVHTDEQVVVRSTVQSVQYMY